MPVAPWETLTRFSATFIPGMGPHWLKSMGAFNPSHNDWLSFFLFFFLPVTSPLLSPCDTEMSVQDIGEWNVVSSSRGMRRWRLQLAWATVGSWRRQPSGKTEQSLRPMPGDSALRSWAEPGSESSPLDILNLGQETSYFCSQCWTCAICHNGFTVASHFPSLFIICKMGILRAERHLTA